MKVIYYLKTCDTCKRILKGIPNLKTFTLIDIKQTPIQASDLAQMYQRTQSYEVLFSKKSKLYKAMDLKDFDLKEADFKQYILEHYTFLSRPVIIYDETIFVGNSPKNIQKIEEFFNQ